jgi:hypothetical protein
MRLNDDGIIKYRESFTFTPSAVCVLTLSDLYPFLRIIYHIKHLYKIVLKLMDFTYLTTVSSAEVILSILMGKLS